jgi:N12 class adenine-specific DNA methylase
MNPVDIAVTAENRIKGMLEIRDCVRNLIEYQIEDYSDTDIKAEQDTLNRLYDTFIKKYGLINSRANNMAFSEDSSYCLLCSLEVLDENSELLRKADMFTKRTIKQHTIVTSVDTASEALILSISERACVDMGFMQSLTGKSGFFRRIAESSILTISLKTFAYHKAKLTRL